MPQVKKNLVDKKDFNYSHGSATLNFTLFLHDKEAIKSFKKCLAEGIKDIEELLKK